MAKTLIPTMEIRWHIDYDGEKTLQQKFLESNGVVPVWKNIDTVDYWELRGEEERRRYNK